MPRFAEGVIRFQNDIFPVKKDLFERLSLGQSPEALFVTCSDSRIETGMITQTDPGELFVCRNAGNIVPPHSGHTGGMTASIEFAVAVLKVPHIVICGHSECGAMKGAMAPESLESLPHVREWLGFSRAAVDITQRLCGDKSEDERMQMLLEQNVLLQLQHLRTHPAVATALASNEIELHGWVYDIKTGEVRAHNGETDAFEPVADRYASELAAAATDGCAA